MSQLDRDQKTRILYIEKKSGHSDDGPARIGRVAFSKSGRTLYYRGLRLRRMKGGGISGNYFDVETGDEYWVSGAKRDGRDRHRAGRGPVEVDDDVREEYRRWIRGDDPGTPNSC